MQIKSEIISSTNIAEAIVDYAEEKNFKLIVIGTRGKSGFKKLLLGSVASSVGNVCTLSCISSEAKLLLPKKHNQSDNG